MELHGGRIGMMPLVDRKYSAGGAYRNTEWIKNIHCHFFRSAKKLLRFIFALRIYLYLKFFKKSSASLTELLIS
jgi:hypothetical protein